MAYLRNYDNHLLQPPSTCFPSTLHSTTRMTFVSFFLVILLPNLFITLAITSHLSFCSVCLQRMFDKSTCEYGWVDKSPIDTYPMSLPCVVIVAIIVWLDSCVFPCNTLTPYCIRGHDDPSCWFANGRNELHTIEIVVEHGFAIRAQSNTWWAITTPCGPNALGGGTTMGFGGHVDCTSGNVDYVCALVTNATFVGQGICGNALDVTIDTLGGQPRFIGQPGVYGGQLPYTN